MTKTQKTNQTCKKPSKLVEQPDKAWEIIKFIPISGSPAVHSSAPVTAPAFSVSQHRETYLVESIKISGECYHELKINSFPDAIEECARRMKEQSTTSYTIERG